MKKIQIGLDLFLWIYDYIKDKTDTEAIMIRQAMDEKLDKILARELYSKYKRLPSGAEREQARIEYLEHVGISRGYITEK